MDSLKKSNIIYTGRISQFYTLIGSELTQERINIEVEIAKKRRNSMTFRTDAKNSYSNIPKQKKSLRIPKESPKENFEK